MLDFRCNGADVAASLVLAMFTSSADAKSRALLIGASGHTATIRSRIWRDGSGLTPNLCALGQESLSATIATRDVAMASVGTAAELDRLIGDVVGSGTRGFGTALKAEAAPKVAMETYMLELSVAP